VDSAREVLAWSSQVEHEVTRSPAQRSPTKGERKLKRGWEASLPEEDDWLVQDGREGRKRMAGLRIP